MANIQNKTQWEKANRAYLKMRSDYRASLVELPIEFDRADFVDDGKTILHGPRLVANQKLTVKIPRWTGIPVETFSDVVTLLLDRGDGKGFVDVAAHTFTRHKDEADFREDFPYPVDISIQDLPRDATCQLKYHIDYYNDSEDDSDAASFLCDQVKPYDGVAPAALTLANPNLDDTSLPVGSTLKLTLPPGYANPAEGKYDWKLGDILAVYLVDGANPPDDLEGITPIYVTQAPNPGITGAVVEIDADKIRALGDILGVFLYVLRDSSLNDSVVSLWTTVSLTFGPLPTPLLPPTVPQADPGPLLLEDARNGVSVWIKRHAAFKPGDAVELKWGNTVVWPDFPIPDNGRPEIEIPVAPSRIMLLEYGQNPTGEKDTAISYKVIRKGRPFDAPPTTIKVDLAVAIPWLPWPPEEEWPIPTHPSLLKGEVENHDGTRTNELTRADKDEDATFTFTWYAQAVNGHVVKFYWNGTEVVEAQLEFDDTAAPGGPEHKPGEDVTVDIPWAYIKGGGNDSEIPVQYSITATGLDNDLYSEITEVDVNANSIELPPASFPTVTGNFPNCASLEANGDLRVKIPDLSRLLKVGDEIHVTFTPMTGESGPETPIADAAFEADFILGATNPITGFEFLVTPYATHIKPLYDQTAATNRRGRMKIEYSFDDKTEVIGSEPLTRLTAFHEGSDSCPIPRP